ncbi:hypothetical protein JRI60_48710 [Archangium violaceum]|uniref:hypothetical protein n=1 Tax=Archangium violaceum TaxID=83451 RepID=UPI00194E658A|nr:hypothetical protein [Archangium violaceum]QRN96783.1 hypothetical protein JRI60_48710 [Archangium violaceum]
MTAEAPSAATAPRPQCPRCATVLPAVSQGTQVIRCAGCGAALQVSVRPVEPSAPPLPGPSADGPGVARPRRRPMVEVPGPRRVEAEPTPAPAHTITVELSQRDIDYEPEPEPGSAPSTPAPVRPPTPAPAASADVPWFAEDIERLPETNVDLGQLALENFEPYPPLPLPPRPDVPPSSRSVEAPSRPPGVPASHSQVK